MHPPPNPPQHILCKWRKFIGRGPVWRVVAAAAAAPPAVFPAAHAPPGTPTMRRVTRARRRRSQPGCPGAARPDPKERARTTTTCDHPTPKNYGLPSKSCAPRDHAENVIHGHTSPNRDPTLRPRATVGRGAGVAPGSRTRRPRLGGGPTPSTVLVSGATRSGAAKAPRTPGPHRLPAVANLRGAGPASLRCHEGPPGGRSGRSGPASATGLASRVDRDACGREPATGGKEDNAWWQELVARARVRSRRHHATHAAEREPRDHPPTTWGCRKKHREPQSGQRGVLFSAPPATRITGHASHDRHGSSPHLPVPPDPRGDMRQAGGTPGAGPSAEKRTAVARHLPRHGRRHRPVSLHAEAPPHRGDQHVANGDGGPVGPCGASAANHPRRDPLRVLEHRHVGTDVASMTAAASPAPGTTRQPVQPHVVPPCPPCPRESARISHTRVARPSVPDAWAHVPNARQLRLAQHRPKPCQPPPDPSRRKNAASLGGCGPLVP